MLLPKGVYLPPETALMMLAGVHCGSEHGGSIASIQLNRPGMPSASVTCLDGSLMARQGRAGVAMVMTAIASFFGGMVGIPGSATMPLMPGAPGIHGITPGPALIAEHPELFSGLVFSFLVGNLFLQVLIGLWGLLLASAALPRRRWLRAAGPVGSR